MLKNVTFPEVLLVAVLVAAPIVAQIFAPGSLAMLASTIAVVLAFLKQRGADVPELPAPPPEEKP